MKFSVNQGILRNHLTKIVKVVKENTFIPILNNFLIEADAENQALSITGSDSTIFLKHLISGAKIKEGGITTLPAVPLTKLINALPNTMIEFRTEDNGMRIIAGKSKFFLRSMGHEDFPKGHDIEDAGIEVDLLDTQKSIGQVAFSTAKDLINPYLTGVRISEENIISADGRRLAIIAKSFLDRAVLLPDSFVSHFLSLEGEKATFFFSESVVKVITPTITLSGVMLIGVEKFPKVGSFIQSHMPYGAIINLSDILPPLERALIFQSKGAILVIKFLINPEGTMTIQSYGQDTTGNSQEIIPVEIIDFPEDMEEFSIALNLGFVNEGLSSLKSSQVRFEYQDAKSMARFVADDWYYIMAPVRLEGE